MNLMIQGKTSKNSNVSCKTANIFHLEDHRIFFFVYEFVAFFIIIFMKGWFGFFFEYHYPKLHSTLYSKVYFIRP